MGRLVRKPRVVNLDSQIAALEGAVQSGLAGMQAAKADPGDSYLERMVKYVPAEIIAFSMVINAILEQAMKSGDGHGRRAGPGHRRRRIDRCRRVDAAAMPGSPTP